MKKQLLIAALFVAMGAAAKANPENRTGLTTTLSAGKENFNDGRDNFHWQTVERRVWIPAQRIRSFFGWRVIPGHYDVIRERIKVYNRGYDGRNDRDRGFNGGRENDRYPQDNRNNNGRDNNDRGRDNQH